MPVDSIRLRWNNTVILEEADGSNRKIFKNTTTDAFRQSVASALAEQVTGLPATIKLGKASLAEYAYSNRSGEAAFDAGIGASQLAQGFKVSAAGPINSVAVYLRRIGSSNGTIWAEIQTDSAGNPSGTPVTNGVSDSVPINYIESVTTTNGGWVRFTFPSTLPQLATATQYHLVLRTTGFTYVLNTTEIRWQNDTTSPSYADGELRYYDGSWHSAGADAIFKVLGQTDGVMTDVISSLVSADIVAKSKYNAVTARFLASFGVADAVDYIGEVGLFDDLGTMLAIANVSYDKSTLSTGINVYWLIEILAEPA